MKIEQTAGRQAEHVAAQYLLSQGYVIVDQNWRHPRAEIDIIARQGNCLYIVEVKYRRTVQQGAGLDYITPAKLQQLRRALQIWRTSHRWTGEVNLAAIEVSGPAMRVTAFITDL